MGIIAAALLGVASRQVFDLFSRLTNGSKILFDISSVASIESLVMLNIVLINSNDSITSIQADKLEVYHGNKKLGEVLLNNNSYKLQNGQALELEDLTVKLSEPVDMVNLNFRVLAKVNNVTTSLKPVESNNYGGVYSSDRLNHYQNL